MLKNWHLQKLCRYNINFVGKRLDKKKWAFRVLKHWSCRYIHTSWKHCYTEDNIFSTKIVRTRRSNFFDENSFWPFPWTSLITREQLKTHLKVETLANLLAINSIFLGFSSRLTFEFFLLPIELYSTLMIFELLFFADHHIWVVSFLSTS
jgi:hypothetical protein